MTGGNGGRVKKNGGSSSRFSRKTRVGKKTDGHAGRVKKTTESSRLKKTSSVKKTGFGKKKVLPAKLKGKTLAWGYKNFITRKFYGRFGCALWLAPDGIWYYWCPCYVCYMPESCIDEYPPFCNCDELPNDDDSTQNDRVDDSSANE
jgi:hypothetical protein